MEKRVIDRFTKESGYDFLSNFYPSTIRFEGFLYSTVEHAYQSAKTTDENIRKIIRNAKTPGDAKKLGQAIVVRENWNQIKIDVMKFLIREKFENPFLRPMLLSTNDDELILNNKWNDHFWGVCKGVGENWLGKILMEERKRIRLEENM